MENELEGTPGAQSQPDEAARNALLEDANRNRGEASGDAQLVAASGRDLYQWGPDSPSRPDAQVTDRRQNPDGSMVEIGVGADGRPHPIRIVYADGRSTQYGYDRNGKVNEVVNLDVSGRVADHWVDRGNNCFVETRTNQVLEGVHEMHADGTYLFRGRGFMIETRTDGSLLTRLPGADGLPHTLLARGDGSVVDFVNGSDGRDYMTRVKFPNGNETTYDYDQYGRVYQVTDWGLGGPLGGNALSSYSTRDGRSWNEAMGRGPVLVGELRLTPDGQHVWRNAQDGTIWIRRPDGQITLTDPNGQVIWQQPGTSMKGPGR